jgi:hypothetical protein
MARTVIKPKDIHLNRKAKTRIQRLLLDLLDRFIIHRQMPGHRVVKGRLFRGILMGWSIRQGA